MIFFGSYIFSHDWERGSLPLFGGSQGTKCPFCSNILLTDEDVREHENVCQIGVFGKKKLRA